MRVSVIASVLVAALVLAGCTVDPYPAEKAVEVAGKPDGFMPTNNALKLMLSKPNGDTTLVAFDRADWYVAALEKEITYKSIKYVAVVGDETSTRAEVVATLFKDPNDFNKRFRYDELSKSHTAEEIEAMDAEWDTRLREQAGSGSVNVGRGGATDALDAPTGLA